MQKVYIENKEITVKFSLETALEMENRFGDIQVGLKELKKIGVSAWLYRIMLNNCIKEHNRKFNDNIKPVEDISEVVKISSINDCTGFINAVQMIIFNDMQAEERESKPKKKATGSLKMMLNQLLCRLRHQ